MVLREKKVDITKKTVDGEHFGDDIPDYLRISSANLERIRMAYDRKLMIEAMIKHAEGLAQHKVVKFINAAGVVTSDTKLLKELNIVMI